MPSSRISGTYALLIAGVAVVLLAGILAFDQYASRKQAIATNIRHIEQNDRMFAEHIARSLDSIDILLDEMRIAIQEGEGWQHWTPAVGHRLLKSRLSRSLPQVRHLLIFDADGHQRHTSFAEIAPAINVRDRPYFRVLADGAERSHYGPYIGRNSGQPTYAVARRLGRQRFEGALMVAIEPSYFDEFCLSSRPLSEFETALVNSEGKIIRLCRSLAGNTARITANAGDDFRQVLGNGEFSAQALSMNRSTAQNTKFLLTMEPVPGHPDLRVVTITPRDLLTQEWLRQALRTLLLAGLALATLTGAGLLIRGHLRQLAALTRQLQQSHETLENRIDSATRELESRRNEALRLADAKTRFFAAASHDLRQPLHALQLFLADLSRLTQIPEQRVLVDRIESAARSIADQLRSLLDISRLDMSTITPEKKRLPLREVFSGLSDTYTPAAQANGVRLVFRAHEAVLETDPALLSRLLGNLIDNAIKFAPGGTVAVCARWRINAVRIEVRDNGRGIPAEHQAEIFDEFFQIENHARNPNAGLGLGLAIAHRVARLLGSNISLRSDAGKGAVFALTLPRLSGKVPEAPSTHSPALRTPRLVVIDDSGTDGQVEGFAERAQRWGYEVVRAADVAAAWRLLDDSLGIPVVFHTKGCMMSGEVQSLLRAHQGILITGKDCAIPELGAYHLREPVKPARLRALLRSLH